jgi:hypothetical protein
MSFPLPLFKLISILSHYTSSNAYVASCLNPDIYVHFLSSFCPSAGCYFLSRIAFSLLLDHGHKPCYSMESTQNPLKFGLNSTQVHGISILSAFFSSIAPQNFLLLPLFFQNESLQSLESFTKNVCTCIYVLLLLFSFP